VLSEALSNQRALGLGDRQAILVCDDAIPERTNVPNLLVRCQFVETRWRYRERAGHEPNLAHATSTDNVALRPEGLGI
jgi:hypothetical protein